MTIQTLMIRRRALEQVGGFDETLAILEGARPFRIEIARAGMRVVFLPESCVARHRRHDQNITRNAMQYFVCDCRIALRYRRLSAEIWGGVCEGSYKPHIKAARCQQLRARVASTAACLVAGAFGLHAAECRRSAKCPVFVRIHAIRVMTAALSACYHRCWNHVAFQRGFGGGTQGRILYVLNESSTYQLTLNNENTGSASTNNLELQIKEQISRQSARLIYDSTDSRWLVQDEGTYRSNPQ